jgi:transcriptional regulator with XRE-family HTH domain
MIKNKQISHIAKGRKMDKPKNRIKEVLEERGIKQTWLAERLGKSFCIVNSYVCNRRQPSLDVLFEIAKILSVDPKELIGSKE